MGNNDDLVMTFDPNVIDHLGVQLYSTLPPVIAELVANSYDAEAENIAIYLSDEGKKEIKIEDDGHGMSYEEINPEFLKIGRHRRETEQTQKSKSGKRYVIGKKGIGKLSFFGIAKHIKIETVKDCKKTTFELDWDALKEQGKNKGEYSPNLLEKEIPVNKKQGTTVTLTKIKRKSGFQPDDLAISLAKSFQIFDENDFSAEIIYNNNDPIKLTNALRYKNIKEVFVWNLAEDNSKIQLKFDYEFKDKIKGNIISAKETVPANMRGIALFSRGKLVNQYSFYDVKATSHGYSYITGWLDIDFIDDFEEDVISTDRQSLNWENEETSELKEYLQDVIRAFYNERTKKIKEEKLKELKNESGIDLELWISDLPKHERKLAKKITDAIIDAEGLNINKSAELVKFTKDAFQFEAFKELAHEIEESVFENPEKIIELFKEWEVIEAREIYKIAQVRLETIEKFEKHINGNSKEVPELHNFFKKFPWLLDSNIMNFQDEVTYSKLLKDNFKDDDIEGPNRRIDFLCHTFADDFFIIELKRPNAVISNKELDQALEYAAFVKGKLGNEKDKNVYCYIIGSRLANTDSVKLKAKAYKNDKVVYFKTYEELLSKARGHHKEFIDKYKELQKK